MGLVLPVLRLLGDVLAVLIAALAGNWAGDRIRRRVTRKPGHVLHVLRQDAGGEARVVLNPLITNLLPALLMGLIARPGWLSAFLVGLMSSGWMGDRYEQSFYEWLRRKLGRR